MPIDHFPQSSSSHKKYKKYYIQIKIQIQMQKQSKYKRYPQSYPLTNVQRRYQIKHYQGFQRRLVKRQMGQFQNLCSDDFLQSSRMTIRTYTAPRGDSYRAGLKNRSGPWCNPGVLSAQTFVVSDKHSSIQKTIFHVRCLAFPILCMYSAMFYLVWNCYFCKSCLWKTFVTCYKRLSWRAFYEGVPTPVNISLWLHILRYLGLWSVLLWHRHSGWCTQHPLTAASFTSFMLCLTSPQIYTRITDTRKYLILKPSSVNTIQSK